MELLILVFLIILFFKERTARQRRKEMKRAKRQSMTRSTYKGTVRAYKVYRKADKTGHYRKRLQ